MLEQKLIRMEQVLSYDKPLQPESVQPVKEVETKVEPITNENKDVSEYVGKLIAEAQETVQEEGIVEEKKE